MKYILNFIEALWQRWQKKTSRLNYAIRNALVSMENPQTQPDIKLTNIFCKAFASVHHNAISENSTVLEPWIVFKNQCFVKLNPWYLWISISGNKSFWS